MNDKLFKILKEFKNIEPDANYTRRSRLLILGGEKIMISPKYRFFDVLKIITSNRLTLAAEIAVILMIFIASTAYYIHQSNQNLVVQANELNATIQLKLNEITSFINNQSSVNPSRANEVNLLLDKATSELNEADTDLKNGKLEDSLAKMKSAQEAFSQIESIIKK